MGPVRQRIHIHGTNRTFYVPSPRSHNRRRVGAHVAWTADRHPTLHSQPVSPRPSHVAHSSRRSPLKADARACGTCAHRTGPARTCFCRMAVLRVVRSTEAASLSPIAASATERTAHRREYRAAAPYRYAIGHFCRMASTLQYWEKSTGDVGAAFQGTVRHQLERLDGVPLVEATTRVLNHLRPRPLFPSLAQDQVFRVAGSHA